MERYKGKTNKDFRNAYAPNHWTGECTNPRYILDVLLSAIQTAEGVKGLPDLKI